MDSDLKKIIVPSIVASAFVAAVVSSGIHLFFENWQENRYQAGYDDGYRAYAADLEACQIAKEEAGRLLGEYILGENNVSQTQLDNAEQREEILCNSFE